MRMQTPIRLQPAQHLQHQRSGAIDPDALLKACDAVVQKSPELLEVCKQAGDAGGWWQNGFPAGFKDATQFVSTLVVGGIGGAFAIRTNGFTTFANRLSKKTLRHINAQKEPHLRLVL